MWVGVIIVVIRVVFRLVFGGGYPGTVVLDLPLVPLPEWVAGITLLGLVTREALLAGLYDGLRLATIVICIGAANSLANPKRLLRSVPPALYEIGTALVVAVTVLPQFADSVRRVRAAQSLRAGETGRVGRLRGSSCRCSRTPNARSRSPPAWTRAGTAGPPVSRPPGGRPPAP